MITAHLMKSNARPKVVARVFGGLGNQLFIYAAARRLALANGADLVLDDVSGFARDHVYRRRYQLDRFSIAGRPATPAERLEPFSLVRRYLWRKMNMRRPFEQRSYLVEERGGFDERLLRIQPRTTLYLEGYWQSESFFRDVQDVIRSDLRMEGPADAANRQMATRIDGCEAIALHVRFFDTPGGPGGNNAPAAYYQRAIATMRARYPGARYFLFSDRLQDARAAVGLPDELLTCVDINQGDAGAPADLWLMRRCRHFVIANSTFSWWAAWLGEHAGKHIIAPGIGVHGPKAVTAWNLPGQLPSDWQLL